MSCIVYQINKKPGAKYAYESVSYWDKEKNQPRSKRKYLGRVDPVSNEIIYSSGRKTHSEDDVAGDDAKLSRLQEEIANKDRVIKELREELENERRESDKRRQILRQIHTLAGTEN